MHKACIVCADNRHQRCAGFDKCVYDHVVDATGPDTVKRNTCRKEIKHLLFALVLLPSGEDLVNDVDIRVFRQSALETVVTVRVGRDTGDAAHVHHVAFATQLFEQPFRAEIGVFFLIIRQDVSALCRHTGINRDHNDVLRHGSIKRGVERVWV